MAVWVIFTILLYVLGAVPTFYLFDKTTEQPMFNKVWFTIFWPAVSLITLVTTLIKKK